MTKRFFRVLALAILAATCSTAASSNEFAGPAPSLLFELQTKNFGHPWLRVTTDSSRLTLRARRIDESGLSGITTRPSDPPVPDHLRWHSIARIDEVVTRGRAGRITGFVVGGALGLGLGSAIGESMRSKQADAAPYLGDGTSSGHGGAGMVLGLALLGGLGAWQGGRIGDRMVRERGWYAAEPSNAASPVAVDNSAATTPSPPVVSATVRDTVAAASQLSSPPPPGASAQSPAPGTVMRLDDRLARTRRARITTQSGQIVAGGVRASAEGLAYDGILSTTRGNTLPGPGRIAWDATVRVEVPGNHALRAATVTGLVLGGLVVAAFASVRPGDDIGGGGAIAYAVPVGVVLAGGVGALIPGWHPVYRGRRASARGR